MTETTLELRDPLDTVDESIQFLTEINERQAFNYTWTDGKLSALINTDGVVGAGAGAFLTLQLEHSDPALIALLAASIALVAASLTVCLRQAVPRMNSGRSGPQNNLRAQTGITAFPDYVSYESAVRSLSAEDRLRLLSRQVYGMATNNVRSFRTIRLAALLTSGACLCVAAAAVYLAFMHEKSWTHDRDERKMEDMEPDSTSGLLIAGKWRPGNGPELVSHNPSDSAVVWRGASASADDVSDAVTAAEHAWPVWSASDVSERHELLQRGCTIISKRKADLANAIATEVGKPYWEAEAEVDAVLGKLEPTARALAERCAEKQGPRGAVTRFVPLGPVGVLGPYNFPIHMPNVHVMPALLAGNTVVLKQSELAPLCGKLIAQCWDDAGLPSGVFNVVQGGPEVGSALCNDPRIRGIFFTGGESAGRAIADSHSASGKLLALEMGGNTPLVVWDAEDLDAAVWIALQSSFITAGQRCSSARRIIVRNSEFGEAFIERFVAAARALRVGRPFDVPPPFMGPLVSMAAAQKMLSYQDELIKAGGEPLLLARQKHGNTPLVTPGIIDISASRSRLDREVLGPLVTLLRVDLLSEAIEASNETRFGLAAAIVTASPSEYDDYRRGVECGVVSWNAATTGNSAEAAFGGVKASGNYRPTGYYSIDYCMRAVGGVEVAAPSLPDTLPPGVVL